MAALEVSRTCRRASICLWCGELSIHGHHFSHHLFTTCRHQSTIAVRSSVCCMNARSSRFPGETLLSSSRMCGAHRDTFFPSLRSSSHVLHGRDAGKDKGMELGKRAAIRMGRIWRRRREGRGIPHEFCVPQWPKWQYVSPSLSSDLSCCNSSPSLAHFCCSYMGLRSFPLSIKMKYIRKKDNIQKQEREEVEKKIILEANKRMDERSLRDRSTKNCFASSPLSLWKSTAQLEEAEKCSKALPQEKRRAGKRSRGKNRKEKRSKWRTQCFPSSKQAASLSSSRPATCQLFFEVLRFHRSVMQLEHSSSPFSVSSLGVASSSALEPVPLRTSSVPPCTPSLTCISTPSSSFLLSHTPHYFVPAPLPHSTSPLTLSFSFFCCISALVYLIGRQPMNSVASPSPFLRTVHHLVLDTTQQSTNTRSSLHEQFTFSIANLYDTMTVMSSDPLLYKRYIDFSSCSNSTPSATTTTSGSGSGRTIPSLEPVPAFSFSRILCCHLLLSLCPTLIHMTPSSYVALKELLSFENRLLDVDGMEEKEAEDGEREGKDNSWSKKHKGEPSTVSSKSTSRRTLSLPFRWIASVLEDTVCSLQPWAREEHFLESLLEDLCRSRIDRITEVPDETPTTPKEGVSASGKEWTLPEEFTPLPVLASQLRRSGDWASFEVLTASWLHYHHKRHAFLSSCCSPTTIPTISTPVRAPPSPHLLSSADSQFSFSSLEWKAQKGVELVRHSISVVPSSLRTKDIAIHNCSTTSFCPASPFIVFPFRHSKAISSLLSCSNCSGYHHGDGLFRLSFPFPFFDQCSFSAFLTHLLTGLAVWLIPTYFIPVTSITEGYYRRTVEAYAEEYEQEHFFPVKGEENVLNDISFPSSSSSFLELPHSGLILYALEMEVPSWNALLRNPIIQSAVQCTWKRISFASFEPDKHASPNTSPPSSSTTPLHPLLHNSLCTRIPSLPLSSIDHPSQMYIRLHPLLSHLNCGKANLHFSSSSSSPITSSISSSVWMKEAQHAARAKRKEESKPVPEDRVRPLSRKPPPYLCLSRCEEMQEKGCLNMMEEEAKRADKRRKIIDQKEEEREIKRSVWLPKSMQGNDRSSTRNGDDVEEVLLSQYEGESRKNLVGQKEEPSSRNHMRQKSSGTERESSCDDKTSFPFPYCRLNWPKQQKKNIYSAPRPPSSTGHVVAEKGITRRPSPSPSLLSVSLSRKNEDEGGGGQRYDSLSISPQDYRRSTGIPSSTFSPPSSFCVSQTQDVWRCCEGDHSFRSDSKVMKKTENTRAQWGMRPSRHVEGERSREVRKEEGGTRFMKVQQEDYSEMLWKELLKDYEKVYGTPPQGIKKAYEEVTEENRLQQRKQTAAAAAPSTSPNNAVSHTTGDLDAPLPSTTGALISTSTAFSPEVRNPCPNEKSFSLELQRNKKDMQTSVLTCDTAESKEAVAEEEAEENTYIALVMGER